MLRPTNVSLHEIGSLERAALASLRSLRELRTLLRPLLVTYSEDEEEFLEDPFDERTKEYTVCAAIITYLIVILGELIS